MDSIIDVDVIKEYEKETGKQWTETEEHMAEICSFYDYGFSWNKKGNIVINNGYCCGWHERFYKFFGQNIEKDIEEDCELDGDLRHYEYENAENMVSEWLDLCIKTNDDYRKNGLNMPFKWLG